jgi:hypothetical protein
VFDERVELTKFITGLTHEKIGKKEIKLGSSNMELYNQITEETK